MTSGPATSSASRTSTATGTSTTSPSPPTAKPAASSSPNTSGPARRQGEGSGWVIVRLTVTYLAQAHYPGNVDVGTRVERVGRTSCTLGQGLFKDGVCFATAESVLVWLALADGGRPAPFPDALGQRLAAEARAASRDRRQADRGRDEVGSVSVRRFDQRRLARAGVSASSPARASSAPSGMACRRCAGFPTRCPRRCR